VLTERICQRAHSTPSDEGHDYVDCIRRRNLGTKLVPDSRFAWSIREDSGVEQWCKWARHRLQPSVWKPLQQSHKDPTRAEWLIRTHLVPLIRKRFEALNQFNGDADCFLGALSLRRSFDRPRKNAREMARHAIRRLSIAKLRDVGAQRVFRKSCEQLFEAAREQRFMESGLQSIVRQAAGVSQALVKQGSQP
jgi:hypothetical protein